MEGNTYELFAFGSYSDYIRLPEQFLDFPGSAHLKLAKLSVVTVANENEGKNVAFADLLEKHALEQALERVSPGSDKLSALEKLLVEMVDEQLVEALIDEESESVRLSSIAVRECIPENYRLRVLSEESTRRRHVARAKEYLQRWLDERVDPATAKLSHV